MSIVVMLMIGGWIATLSMVGVCALHESGQRLKIRRRIALWLLQPSTALVRGPEEGLQPKSENAA